MILTCTACETRYLIADGAIPPGGRQVRCASCRHSWFQDGPEEARRKAEELPLPPPTPPVAAVAPAPAMAGNRPDTGEEAEAPSTLEPETAQAAKPRWAPSPLARRLMIGGVVLVALSLIGVGSARYFGYMPDLEAVLAQPKSDAPPLLLEVVRQPERRILESGNELFAISGRIVNPTSDEQDIPDIRAELRDARGKLVYNWTITPPQRSIEARGSVDFNAAEVNVPRGAERLNLSF